jgi:hypothetical protein
MSQVTRFLFLAVLLGAALTPQVLALDVDFQRSIRPLLSRSCFECHGPDSKTRKAGLRLDVPPVQHPANPPLLVPGAPEQSLLYQRLTDVDPEDRMPPRDAHHPLSTMEIELIRRWIEEGASWEGHWAFSPPERAPLPEVRNPDWCRDPLDRFILSGLEAGNLQPSVEADRARLLRRASLDLTGLPPTLDQLKDFLGDDSPKAWERVTTRLLAAPAYGERMATLWLDLSRYADTHGYQSDVERPVWPWRDWVIDAFNDNMPFDEFLRWQLAGDLLPDPTRNQRLATTFNRLHRQTNEGGSVEEEFRVEYVADRVHTFGTAMLGLTTECARCHDHKFDPISHEEYYQLFAFFDDIDESGLYSHFTNATPTPSLRLGDDENQRRIKALTDRIVELESIGTTLRARAGPKFEDWLAENPRLALELPDRQGDYRFDSIENSLIPNHADPEKPGQLGAGTEVRSRAGGGSLQLDGDNNASFPGVGEFDRTQPFTISLLIRPDSITERAVVIHRSRAWTDAGSQGYQLLLEDGHPSWSLIHFWPGNAISIKAVDPLPAHQWSRLTVGYDGSSRASGMTLHVDGEATETQIIRDNLTRSITGGGPGALTIGQRFRDRGFKDGGVDELLVLDRALSTLEIKHLHDDTTLNNARASAPGTLADTHRIRHDADHLAHLAELQEARRTLAGELDSTPEIMTMIALDEPRTSRILERGQYDLPGRTVEPDTPEGILPFPDDQPRDRLGLARWTTDPRNPLTARVAVNRLWEIAFGRGLVLTSEDFGSQGSIPSHPKLLDRLAIDLIESGWNVKAMLERIVNSASYRQSSITTQDKRRIDPGNARLSRGPSNRLTAEMLRDQALAASGLLVDTLGGPSVHPYQPAGLWQEKSGRTYPQGSGDALHRRSLYTFWKRTSPPPMMMLFDAANRDVCVARRGATNTPLQALVLLNDPQFVEASRVLAERSMDHGGSTPDEQIAHAFKSLASREPTDREARLLGDLFAEELAGFEEADARLLIGIGDAPTREDIDPVRLAAMTMVCSTILNSDAAVMRR